MKDYARLSAARINSCTPTDGDVWLSDAGGWRGRGQLLVRITPRGGRHFYFRYSAAGERKTISLGRYSHVQTPGFLTLGQARALANQYAALARPVRVGHQPSLGDTDIGALSRLQASAASQTRTGTTGGNDYDKLTVDELCQRYVQWLKRNEKPSWREISYVAVHVSRAAIGKRIASEVNSIEFSAALRRMLESLSPHAVMKVRRVLHAAYAHALRAALSPTAAEESIDPSITSNPITAIPAMSELNAARERVLTKVELQELWRRISIDSDHVPAAVPPLRLALLLGGQRFQQLLRVKLEEVDLETGTILLRDPKGSRRHARIHLLPLCAAAKANVITLMNRSHDRHSRYLFPGISPDRVASKQVVSKFVKEFSLELIAHGKSTSRFQASDLRRTAETLLASLGVSKDLRARILSHGISGVQEKHYDKFDYMPEKIKALTMWESYLNSLLK